MTKTISLKKLKKALMPLFIPTETTALNPDVNTTLPPLNIDVGFVSVPLSPVVEKEKEKEEDLVIIYQKEKRPVGRPRKIKHPSIQPYIQPEDAQPRLFDKDNQEIKIRHQDIKNGMSLATESGTFNITIDTQSLKHTLNLIVHLIEGLQLSL